MSKPTLCLSFVTKYSATYLWSVVSSPKEDTKARTVIEETKKLYCPNSETVMLRARTTDNIIPVSTLTMNAAYE